MKRIAFFLTLGLILALESCASKNPNDPTGSSSASAGTTASTNPIPLRPGQFEMSIYAMNGDASSVSMYAMAFLLSNMTTPTLTANGSSALISYTSSYNPQNLKYGGLSTTGPSVAWTLGNNTGMNSGTVIVPRILSFTVDGVTLTTGLTSTSLDLPIPYSSGSHTVSFTGQGYTKSTLEVVSNGSSYYYYSGYGDDAVTNGLSLNTAGLPRSINLNLYNGAPFGEMVYPNSVGGFGEGYVQTYNSLSINPIWIFSADANEPDNTTNVSVTSLPTGTLSRTIHTNGDVDWYRFTATVGQSYTVTVKPCLAYSALEIGYQLMSNSYTNRNMYAYDSSNSVFKISNSGSGAGTSFFVMVGASWSGYGSNAYQLSVTSP